MLKQKAKENTRNTILFLSFDQKKKEDKHTIYTIYIYTETTRNFKTLNLL